MIWHQSNLHWNIYYKAHVLINYYQLAITTNVPAKQKYKEGAGSCHHQGAKSKENSGQLDAPLPTKSENRN